MSPEWVVTAAHCILKDDRTLYRVTLGDTDRTKEENTEQVFHSCFSILLKRLIQIAHLAYRG